MKLVAGIIPQIERAGLVNMKYMAGVGTVRQSRIMRKEIAVFPLEKNIWMLRGKNFKRPVAILSQFSTAHCGNQKDY